MTAALIVMAWLTCGLGGAQLSDIEVNRDWPYDTPLEMPGFHTLVFLMGPLGLLFCAVMYFSGPPE